MGALTKTLTRLSPVMIRNHLFLLESDIIFVKKLEPLRESSKQAECAFPGKQVVPVPAKLNKVLASP